MRKTKKKTKGTRKIQRVRRGRFGEFKTLLLKKREEVSDEVRHIEKETLDKSPKEASGDLSNYTYHMADMATDNYERDFSYKIVSNEQELLYRIDEALTKIREGTYGKCERCGKRIRKKRLRVMPYAKYCIGCQDEEEGEEADYGGTILAKGR